MSIFSGNLRKETQHATINEPPVRIRLAGAPLSRPAAATTPPPVSLAPRAKPIVNELPKPSAPKPQTIEQTLASILEEPLPAGLTAASGYQMKEQALGSVIASLSIEQCRALYKRLATPVEGDALAHSFATRLTAERRNRLLVFLADARRRQALAAAAPRR